MASRATLVGGIVIGVLGSLVAAGLTSCTENARLQPGRITVRQITGTGAEGLFEFQMPIRNTGLLPGGIRNLEIETVPENSGLIVTDHETSRKRILPFQNSVIETDLVLRKTGGPLPSILRLRYQDTDGDSFQRDIAIICIDGREFLRDFLDVLTTKGRIDLGALAEMSCRGENGTQPQVAARG